jgi:hypothetical protein
MTVNNENTYALPPEVIVNIFQQVTNGRDFIALSLINGQFYEISQIPQACNCPDSLPSYIAKTTDLFMSQLSLREKMILATRIEKKLLSKEALPTVFQANFQSLHKVEFPNEHSKIMIGDYFIIAPYSIDIKVNEFFHNYETNKVLIYHLKTGRQKIFKVHDSEFQAGVGFQTQAPLLATISKKEGLKIWDVDRLMYSSSDKGLIKYDSNTSFSSSCDYSFIPVTAHYNSLLAIGYKNHVAIFEPREPLAFDTMLKVIFNNVQQIQMTDTYLMLCSPCCVAIWKMHVVLQALVSRQPLDIDSAVFKHEIVKYKFAKMYKDTIVLIYEDRRHSAIGEVRDIITGEQIRLLSEIPDLHENKFIYTGEANAIDFLDHFMFNCSNGFRKWDLLSNSAPKMGRFDDYDFKTFHKVYSLGRHVLFASHSFISICKANEDNLPLETLKTPEIISTDDRFNTGTKTLISLELNGKHLITETQNTSELSERHLLFSHLPYSYTITVYDMS